MIVGEFKHGFTSRRLLDEGDRDQTRMSLQEGDPILESFQMR